MKSLADLGVMTVTAAAVRKWIAETPACPIAVVGTQGSPHRYRLDQVLDWLELRARAERVKGFTAIDGTAVLERIAVGRARLEGLASIADIAASTFAGESEADLPLLLSGLSQDKKNESPAQAPTASIRAFDFASATEVESILAILESRADPRNWKATVEAMNARRKWLEAERLIIPVAELDAALQVQVEHVRGACVALGPALKASLLDLVQADQVGAAETLIDEAVADLLARLANDTSLDLEPLNV